MALFTIFFMGNKIKRSVFNTSIFTLVIFLFLIILNYIVAPGSQKFLKYGFHMMNITSCVLILTHIKNNRSSDYFLGIIRNILKIILYFSILNFLGILLDRVEDSLTGEILIPEMHTTITDTIREQTKALAEVVGNSIWETLPVIDTLVSQSHSVEESLLDVNWRPALTVIGADGIPSVQNAGNVLRTNTDLKLSFRIPPGIKANYVEKIIKQKLENETRGP